MKGSGKGRKMRGGEGRKMRKMRAGKGVGRVGR